jgi:two-component system NtrC family sensor kinase
MPKIWLDAGLMTLYLLIPLTAAVASAALASAIFIRDPAQRANRLAACMVAGVTLWSLCEVLWNLQSDADAARIFLRLSALGWVFIGPLSFDLMREITGESRPGHRRTSGSLYAIAAMFLWAAWFTPWMQPEMVATSWGWGYEVGGLHLVYLAFTIACIGVGLNFGRRAYRTASPGERGQALYVGGGILVPLIVASATDALLPLFGFQPPRLGTAAMTVFASSIAWGFYRYGYSLLAPGTFANEILDTLPNGVAMIRVDGRIRSVNAKMAQMYGAPSDFLIGIEVGQLLCGFECDPSEASSEVECQMNTGSGERIAVAVSSTIVCDQTQSPIGLVLVVRDVGEVVALRNSLAMSDRLAAVGKLAAGIAHEINNPLAYVRSNLSLLREHWVAIEGEVSKTDTPDYTSVLLAEGEEMIDESLEGVDRAVAIVRDVRGLSHVEQAARDRSDINVLLDGVIRMARSQLPRTTSIVKQYGELPLLECAPQELHQVFLNLVMNAGQAIAETGEIRVATCVADDWVVVCVSDDGCGIPADRVARVFEPFFTTKSVGEGTGLGLGIALEIVQRHGGRIDVESTAGVGTAFSVRLPLGIDRMESRNPL